MAIPKIKTFEDACKVLKLDPKKCLPKVTDSPKEDQKALTAQAKLFIIIRALNGKWKPDWTKMDKKYYPWWNMDGGFQLFSVSYYDTTSSVGSRLCFKNRELAEYAAEQFIDLYKDLYTLA